MGGQIKEKKHPSRRPLTRCRRGASAFKKPRRGSHLPRPEIRNKRRMCVTDLNIDVLRRIMLFVARSPDGALSFARALSVCKSFRELEKDTEILKCVAFGEQSAKDSHQSFWGLNGLLVRCACAKNADAVSLLKKYVEAQKEVSSLLQFDVEEAIRVARTKHEALVVANTRERKRAFELALKECKEMLAVSQKEGRPLLDHARALCAQLRKKMFRCQLPS